MRLLTFFPLLIGLIAFLSGYFMGDDLTNMKYTLTVVVVLSLGWALFWRTACRNKPPGAIRTAILSIVISLVWVQSGGYSALGVPVGGFGYGLVALCGTAYLICLASPAKWAEVLVARIDTWPS